MSTFLFPFLFLFKIVVVEERKVLKLYEDDAADAWLKKNIKPTTTATILYSRRRPDLVFTSQSLQIERGVNSD